MTTLAITARKTRETRNCFPCSNQHRRTVSQMRQLTQDGGRIVSDLWEHQQFMGWLRTEISLECKWKGQGHESVLPMVRNEERVFLLDTWAQKAPDLFNLHTLVAIPSSDHHFNGCVYLTLMVTCV